MEKKHECCTPKGQVPRYVDCVGCDKKPIEGATLSYAEAQKDSFNIMENKTNPKNAAFANMISSNGCTKREYFAALAMQGLLTRVPKRHGDETDLGIIEARRIAAESRIMADLLIAELNLEGEHGGDNE